MTRSSTPLTSISSSAPSGRRAALRRLSAGAALATGAIGVGGTRPVRAQAQAPDKAGVKMEWPSSITLLDGSAWRAPTAAKPAAVVLVFWSTTCPFCARHNPHVQKLHAAAGPRLRVLTAAQDPVLADVSAYQRRHGYQFPVAREHDALRRLFPARRVIPLTVAIDRDGWVREVIPGEMFEEDVLGFLKVYG